MNNYVEILKCYLEFLKVDKIIYIKTITIQFFKNQNLQNQHNLSQLLYSHSL